MAALFSNPKKEHKDLSAPTFISAGCTIEGKVSTVAMIRIDGTLNGDVETKEGLIVGEEGKVKGNIFAGDVIVFGTVTGDVTATHVEIKASGTVSGQVSTKSLVVESGATYTGFMTMETALALPAAAMV